MIREAMLQDETGVYDLICQMEAKRLDRTAFQRIYASILQDRQHCLLVAIEGACVVGELHLRMEEQLHHCANIAEIMELAVREEFRSQGLGRNLFSKACQIARQEGCVQIEVACNQLRTRAHQFYERQGMQAFHYKFTKNLLKEEKRDNVLGI